MTAVREQAVCGTVEEGRIMNPLSGADYGGKVNIARSCILIKQGAPALRGGI